MSSLKKTWIISESAPNFHEAYINKFFTFKKPSTGQVADVTLQGDIKA
jgi:hypothetical protein